MPTSKAAPRDLLANPALSESVRALARRGEIYSYRKHTLLIQEGAIGDTLYVILSGRLQSFGSNADGNRQLTYGEYGPGEYVGEMSLDGGPRSASVKVLEATTCALITRQTLEAHLAAEPAFAFELLSKVIRRARAATLSAKKMALNDVYGRLKMQLQELALPAAEGGFVTSERLTHQEFADRLGCGREMVSRVLKDLESGGYVIVEPDRRLRWKQLPARW
jgi:CRP/FNR family cyclic AMP-dependent transcriptional regulator